MKASGAGNGQPAAKAPSAPFTVSRVPVERTLALRQAVLRPDQTLEPMSLPGDDDPAAVAFAAVDPGGEVLSVARVTLEAPPFPSQDLVPPGTPAWRLRGMATRPEARNRGIGSAVLQGCNARVPAVGLYRRAGFTPYGDEWVDPDIGPHIVMWRTVGET
jgi:GNAT superfamily N-acetyltransferase